MMDVVIIAAVVKAVMIAEVTGEIQEMVDMIIEEYIVLQVKVVMIILDIFAQQAKEDMTQKAISETALKVGL